MKIVQTPLDGQSKHVQKSPMRKAAGAEHDEPTQPRGSMLAAFARQSHEPQDDDEDFSTILHNRRFLGKTRTTLADIAKMGQAFEQEGGEA